MGEQLFAERPTGLSAAERVMIHPSARVYGNSTLGEGSIILDNVVIGYPNQAHIEEISARGSLDFDGFKGTRIGRDALIRSYSIIYCDVEIGEALKTGHGILVRENTTIGDRVLVGTHSIIDGGCRVGCSVSIQSGVYIPTNSVIEDHVFLGPCCTLTNDKYPLRVSAELEGPIIRRGASIGANATILPDIVVGEGAMVAAGAVVTQDVPPWHLAVGVPARIRELPENLQNLNEF